MSGPSASIRFNERLPERCSLWAGQNFVSHRIFFEQQQRPSFPVNDAFVWLVARFIARCAFSCHGILVCRRSPFVQETKMSGYMDIAIRGWRGQSGSRFHPSRFSIFGRLCAPPRCARRSSCNVRPHKARGRGIGSHIRDGIDRDGPGVGRWAGEGTQASCFTLTVS